MEEFSKFSIGELNTAIFILDEFQKYNTPDPSLKNLRSLIEKEINTRVSLLNPSDIEDLKTKYLGRYVGYKKSEGEVEYFRIDNINYFKDISIISIESKLIICQNDDWFFIQYSPDCSNICNLSPSNLDMRDFFLSSEEEFKEILYKIINNGLTDSQ